MPRESRGACTINKGTVSLPANTLRLWQQKLSIAFDKKLLSPVANHHNCLWQPIRLCRSHFQVQCLQEELLSLLRFSIKTPTISPLAPQQTAPLANNLAIGKQSALRVSLRSARRMQFFFPNSKVLSSNVLHSFCRSLR